MQSSTHDESGRSEPLPDRSILAVKHDSPGSGYWASLRRENLRTYFESSPTVRLLRSNLAPLIIDFLNQTFKLGESISLGLTDLKTRLLNYQEDLHQSNPDLMIGAPERYVADWVDAGWLQRFLEVQSSEPQYQLTRYSEEAIRFVDSSLAKSTSMVGTESRLKLVIETLEDIVRGASADPERRLDYLKNQKTAIEKQIEDIQSGKSIQVYRPAQIRERFQTAVELLRALLSDFRAVEERFQFITRDVQQLQVTGGDSRGSILGFALDSEDVLKQQDEGISFFAFVAFLFSPTLQASLRKSIEEVQQLDALVDQVENLQHVRRMVPSLLAEAEKVMKTTARLSSTLRRLLDARSAEHRMRLASVLQSIKQTALQLREQTPSPLAFLTVYAELEIACPLARKFWTPNAFFDSSDPTLHEISLEQAQEMARRFANLKRIDYRQMRRLIQQRTYDGSHITLGQLIATAQEETGVVELLGYVQIAYDDGHTIDRDRTEIVFLTLHDQGRSQQFQITLPEVTFQPKASTMGRKAR